MPLYDYKCATHGLFHELATIEDREKPKPCPKCKRLSARVIMIPPQILAMAPEKRKSMQRNEQAQFEPIVSGVAIVGRVANPWPGIEPSSGHRNLSF